MPEPLTLELPKPTPSDNTLRKMHPGTYATYRDRLCMQIRQKMARAGVSPTYLRAKPGRRRKVDMFAAYPMRAQVTFHRYSSGDLDDSNFRQGCKALLDALVIEGVIFDDARKWLDDRYEQHRAPPRQGRTVVEVSFPS